jgi:putative membrane protein
MVLCIGFGLLMLLRLDRSVARGKAMPVGVFATIGLLAVLAFSLASVWQWGWALLRLAGGEAAISFDNPRYLLVAACQPFIALFCLYRLFGWYRLAKQEQLAAHGSGSATALSGTNQNENF